MNGTIPLSRLSDALSHYGVLFRLIWACGRGHRNVSHDAMDLLKAESKPASVNEYVNTLLSIRERRRHGVKLHSYGYHDACLLCSLAGCMSALVKEFTWHHEIDTKAYKSSEHGHASML